ncbi:unnamed protein product [Leuciscus chuanchicus]
MSSECPKWPWLPALLQTQGRAGNQEPVPKVSWEKVWRRRRAFVDTTGKRFTSPACTFNGTELQGWLEGNNWLKAGDVDRNDTATLWAPLEDLLKTPRSSSLTIIP